MAYDVSRSTSKWLYQYCLFAYVSARSWGQEPLVFDLDTLQFDFGSPGTPAAISHSPPSTPAGGDSQARPSDLCRWSIHLAAGTYNFIGDASAAQESETQPVEISQGAPEFVNHLTASLATSNFSNIPTTEISMNHSRIADASKKSPDEMLREAFCFAIMARNRDLVGDLMGKLLLDEIDVQPCYPLHIATSYLDGSSSCCIILYDLCQNLNDISSMYVNERGHTVLDNLILTVLQSHARDIPESFGQSLRRDNQFSGAEVDICGRWDADSPCIRALFATPKSKIPFGWKHKFCHTSVQATCHAIMAIHEVGVLRQASSGLFVHDCSTCGTRLKLHPLHTLTLAAFYLGQAGTKDEDLFGMVAVLLCLLSCESDASQAAELSLPLALGQDDTENCSHRPMTPREVSQELSSAFAIEEWAEQSQLGWMTFCEILRLAEQANQVDNDTDSEDLDSETGSPKLSFGDPPYERSCHDGCYDPYHPSHPTLRETAFRHSPKLGHVWAAVQTELLNYRRLNPGDLWVSDNFNLASVYSSLTSNEPLSIPLIDKQMMKPYCRCGRLAHGGIATREDTSRFYFGNLDNWERTRFIPVPEKTEIW